MAAYQIITVNFEDYDNRNLLDPAALHCYVKEHMATGKKTYVFLEELHNVPEFQKVVDSLHLKKTLIYFTSSNTYMFSGRYMGIEMLPLSFEEYVSETGDTREFSRKYISYLENSSFPQTLELDGDQKIIGEYLSGLYTTVVLKDVVGRYKITDILMLERIIRFVFDNVSSYLPTKSISNAMNSNGRKFDVRTVEKYLQALMDSYILYQVKRYSIKGNSILKRLKSIMQSISEYRVCCLAKKVPLFEMKQPLAVKSHRQKRFLITIRNIY